MKRFAPRALGTTTLLASTLAAAALAGGLTVLPSASAADHGPASLGKGHPATVAPAAGSSTKAAPAGTSKAATPALPSVKSYSQVVSASFTDTAASETFATVSCPTGTKVVGGGAVINTLSLQENLNSSAPATDGKSWRVWVNNAGTADGTFIAYANCAAGVGLYTVVTGTPTTNPAGLQSSASVTCPTGTVPFGGGGIITASGTANNLNTTFPLTAGWRVDANNATGTDTSVVALAVCGKKPGKYVQVAGASTTQNPSTQAKSDAFCPTGTVPFGGGAFSSSPNVAVNLNSTLPLSNGWRSYQNNSSTGTVAVTAYVVCGRVLV